MPDRPPVAQAAEARWLTLAEALSAPPAPPEPPHAAR